MDIGDIVSFWRGEQSADHQKRWAHRLDRKVLDAGPHSFNLDYPISPYVGDVVNAPVVILNANAGYNATLTSTEFPDDDACSSYVDRVDRPEGADWSFVSRYYNDTNYGHLVASGRVVVVNACAYRSRKISEESDNQKMIPRLPSCIFTRRWLLEAALPMAKNGKRLIVVNRGGHWHLPANFSSQTGVTKDPAPVSPRITSTALQRMSEFLDHR